MLREIGLFLNYKTAYIAAPLVLVATTASISHGQPPAACKKSPRCDLNLKRLPTSWHLP